MAESGFNFQKLIDESKLALTTPKEYFSSLAKEGGFGEPIIKALIYGLTAGVITFIWSILKLAPMGGMFGGAAGSGLMIIIGSLIFAVIGLFIGGVILLIVSAICGGNTNYEANVRVTASLMVLSPVNALLSFTSGINLMLGSIIGLLVSLYGIWMLYQALITTLEAKENISKIVSIILAAIPVLIVISTLTCYQTTSTLTEKYMKDMQTDDKEFQNRMMDMMEKMKEKEK